ncbi:hypothetical protein SEPCBS57363_000742 [Sporothrix epigloea]|uniref:Duf1690 domain containing protein n=1 Tax=Sporothrix epigloea TaxID=1892477 RepID=A0ABP0D6D9_9PEZI
MGSGASKPATPHTDITRAQTLELHVQARVTEELRRLQAEQFAKLKGLEQAIEDETKATAPDSTTTTSSVSKEIAGLRARLEDRQREVNRPLPESVEAARGAVIRCLREHDRRPLDCYREVAAFKNEVRKLEATWVEQVVS